MLEAEGDRKIAPDFNDGLLRLVVEDSEQWQQHEVVLEGADGAREWMVPLAYFHSTLP